MPLFYILLGLRRAFATPQVQQLLLMVFSLIAFASVFYHYVEGWAWFDSLYFSVITISTVGYGDFSPQTWGGKFFTMFYVLIGIGLFVAAAASIADNLISERESVDKQE